MIKSATGATGNKLRINHGVGMSYYYDTSGTFTLEDLDGNQVEKGSARSVGQGGSETLDELVGTKSIYITICSIASAPIDALNESSPYSS